MAKRKSKAAEKTENSPEEFVGLKLELAEKPQEFNPVQPPQQDKMHPVQLFEFFRLQSHDRAEFGSGCALISSDLGTTPLISISIPKNSVIKIENDANANSMKFEVTKENFPEGIILKDHLMKMSEVFSKMSGFCRDSSQDLQNSINRFKGSSVLS